MTKDALLGLLLSLPIGILSGLYSSLVVTKYARFSELRREALRIIRSINYIGGESHVSVQEPTNLASLALVASDFYSLGHRSAGNTVNSLYDIILSCNSSVVSGAMAPQTYAANHSEWQHQVRKIGPSKHIYLPWGWP